MARAFNDAEVKSHLAVLERQARGSSRTVDASYDVAQTNDNNSRHWANADDLSARSANSQEVRRTTRKRARYEALENNCYAKGMVLTLANDTIGTGPRLQLRTPDAEVNSKVETQFAEWCEAVHLAEKLRSMRVAKCVDGETFAHFTTNESLRTPVKLDVVVSECDHFTSPMDRMFDPRVVDGIEYDAAGNPLAYYRQKAHPGGDMFFSMDSERLDASQVIHLFRVDRPGQLRGFSEIGTALPLFAQIRRFTLATISAAEFAASQNAVMETTGSAISEPDDVDALDAIPFERNGLLTLPKGWKANQMKSEHPTTTYEMFKRQLIQEMARCLSMPFNVAAGDSSDYNYASGRLDHQTYFKTVRVERSYFACACLDRIFLAWLKEASLIPGYLPEELRAMARIGQLPPHEYFYDGDEHVDPMKEAGAAVLLRDAGLRTESEYWASKGKDWEQQHDQLEREQKSREKRGLKFVKDPNPNAAFADDTEEEAPANGKQKPARQAA
jgi:lambda family phage portal protein